MIDTALILKTKEKAKRILEENKYEVVLNNILYRRTVPSKKFYVHQWNWDSATHAMGLIHVDPERAYDELRSLFAGQWENGMIPHMIFNPHETAYFPDAKVWGTQAFASGEILTSGMTQPPLITKSVLHVYKNDPNRDRARKFLTEVINNLIRYHTYLKKYRDPTDIGLLTIIHPWEPGTDNSPRFDEAMERIPLEEIPDHVIRLSEKRTDIKVGKQAHRPTPQDYYRYLYLVDLFKNWQWDYTTIVEQSPFAIQDVFFTSLWYEANQCLVVLLKEDGQNERVKRYAEFAAQTKEALLSLWNPEFEQFVDRDVAKGRSIMIRENTIGTFLPLLIPDLPKDILEALLKKLTDKKQYATPFPVPTASLNSPKFDLMRYWRGPTWPITNLFLIEGLGRQNHPTAKRLQKEILEKTLSVIATDGFYEYYDPTLSQSELIRGDKADEKSLGFGSFSWTAAVFIYLTENYLVQ